VTRSRRRCSILASVCVVATVACGSGPPPVPGPGPNVILISLDTVRRDAVGVYHETDGPSPTPNIDLFAAGCVRFDDVWAPTPFTLPSHMTIFTGLHPEVHGVDKRTQVLDPGIPTVAELAAARGYATLGLVSNIWMKGAFGFDRGFDHYETIPFGLTYAARINHRLFELLDGSDLEDRPLFLFLHYIDAHSDYQKGGSNTLPYYSSPELLAELGVSPESTAFCDPDGNCGTAFLTAANSSGRPIDEATIRMLHELYLAGVRALDAEIGKLLQGLGDRGLLENSLVIITSDHGEEFREHGRFVHAQPFVESLAVPLLVRFPGGAHGGRVVSRPVELADLMPSMLVAMGAEPPAYLPSHDLLSGVEAQGESRPVSILGRDKNRRRRFSLRSAEYTLVVDLATGDKALFDRTADPGETIDIAGEHPDVVADLEARLRETLARDRELSARLRDPDAQDRVDTLTEEEQQLLRAIGYLD
jgi:arylsulfatase A-like enzyme